MLNPRAAEHLVKLCGMFGSDHDGERAAAAKLADEHVKRLGLVWRDVILGEGKVEHWRDMARACADCPDVFAPREWKFVRDMARWRGTPSDRQLEWLESLHAQLRSRAAA